MDAQSILQYAQAGDIDSLKQLSDYQDITGNIAFYENSKTAHKVFSRPTQNKQPQEILTNYAQLLVSTMVNFMFARDVEFELVSGEPEVFEIFKEAYKKLKLNLYDPQLATDLFAYGQALESISYSSGNLRYTYHKIKENRVYPVYDDWGDLVVLIREYDKKISNIGDIDIATITEIWTAGDMKQYQDGVLIQEAPSMKIPFVFYTIPEPLWKKAQQLIDRIEVLASGMADTNDYFGRPILKFEGTGLEGIEIQRDTVQAIAAEGDGTGGKPTIDFLTAKVQPEMFRFEFEYITKLIFKLAHVPDISFENLKGLGNLSGIALRLLFLDTILQAEQLFKYFFKFERRVNLLKYWLSIDREDKRFNDLIINVKLGDVLPKDTESVIRQIVQSYTAGIISQQTAIEKNPLVSNVDIERQRLEAEQGGSFVLENE